MWSEIPCEAGLQRTRQPCIPVFVKKAGLNLMLLSLDQTFQAILSCHEEDLQEVLSELPSRIQRRLEMEDLAGSPQFENIGI